jgi:hypothetical protein
MKIMQLILISFLSSSTVAFAHAGGHHGNWLETAGHSLLQHSHWALLAVSTALFVQFARNLSQSKIQSPVTIKVSD